MADKALTSGFSGRKISRGARILFLVLLWVFSIVFLIPFAWLVLTAFKPDEYIRHFPPVWIFKPTWEHLIKIFSDPAINVGQHLANTFLVCELVVLGTLISSALVAYSFSRLRWRGRDATFAVMLATMMVPAQVTMIPLFIMFKKLGWVNTYLPLVVPPFLGSAFFIFLMRQFYLTLPQDIFDAARIDGASEFQIWRMVAIPLVKPALATVALFSFLNAWNDFLGPLIYIIDERLYTLSVALAMFRGEHATDFGELMALSAVMTIPIIVLFFFTQRTFIQGIKMTGVKG